MARALWLADVARDAGLRVTEYPGWRTRGRSWPFSPRWVMAHHTANSNPGVTPSLSYIATDSRIAPLAQLVLGRDGRVVVVASGRCNHAGIGKLPDGKRSGNTYSIGIEAENDGRGEPWPAEQMDVYVRLTAALLHHLGQPASHAIGHKEFALPEGRKIDPSFRMDTFRLSVEAILNPPDPLETLMADLTPAEREVLASFAGYLADKEVEGHSFARQLLAFHREERGPLKRFMARINAALDAARRDG